MSIYGPDLANLRLLGTLFFQFTIISLIAFGGGQTVLPLIERESVAERGWTTTAAFTAALGFGYLVPGPVTTIATFIGYEAAGIPGALVGTAGMFLAPTVLAACAAAGVERLADNRWIRAFSAGAMPGAIGLLGATLWSIARHAVTSPPLALIALAALLLAGRTKLLPLVILIGGAAVALAASLISALAILPLNTR